MILKFIIFGGSVFQQKGGIPMGTYYTPILADSFLNSHETDFIQGFSKKMKEASPMF